MSLASLIKTILFHEFREVSGNEGNSAEPADGQSTFESAASASEASPPLQNPVVRYGNEDVFVFDEYASRTISTVGIYLQNSSILLVRNPVTEGKDLALKYKFAKSDWQILLGDWNGSGVETLGFYDPKEALFMLWDSLDGGNPDLIFHFGPADSGLIALAGDWDGDGVDTVGLYDPKSSHFIMKNSNISGYADKRFKFGHPLSGYIPIVGDWTGECHDTIGLYNPSSGTFMLKNRLQGGAADIRFNFRPHKSDWLPLVGNWSGNGVDGVGLWDPAAGSFYLAYDLLHPGEQRILQFGPKVFKEQCRPFGFPWSNYFQNDGF